MHDAGEDGELEKGLGEHGDAGVGAEGGEGAAQATAEAPAAEQGGGGLGEGGAELLRAGEAGGHGDLVDAVDDVDLALDLLLGVVEGDGAGVEEAEDALDAEEEEEEGQLVEDGVHADAEEGVGDRDGDDDGEEDGQHAAEAHDEAGGEGRVRLLAPFRVAPARLGAQREDAPERRVLDPVVGCNSDVYGEDQIRSEVPSRHGISLNILQEFIQYLLQHSMMSKDGIKYDGTFRSGRSKPEN